MTIGYDSNGRVIERAIYGKTKAEVVRKATAARADVSDGLDLRGDTVTVESLMMTWLHTVVRPNREVGTYDTHLQGYERYIRGPLGQCQAKKLTVPRVQAWVNSLSPKLSPATIWRARATLRAALNYGIKIRLFTFNPAAHVEMPRNQSTEVVALDPDELVRLLDHTAGVFMWGALYHLTP